MPAEPFDIGKLVPPEARRVRLELRFAKDRISIRVLSAEGTAAGAALRAVGGAVLWRSPDAPILLNVPTNLHVLVIDADTEA